MNNILSPLTIGIIFSILIIYISKRFRFRHFVGPLPLPLIGNLYDPKATSIIFFLNSCIRKYGYIFTFWAGYKPMIVIADPIIVRKILTDTSTFIKGSDYTEKFSLVFGKGLVTSNGIKHKEDRKCLGRFFTKAHVAKYHETICDLTDQMISEEIIPNIGKTIDIQDFFHILSLRIFGYFSIGKDYSKPKHHKLAKKINSGVKQGSNIIGTHIILNIPMFSFLPTIKKVKNIVHFVDSHITNVINKRYEIVKQNETVYDDILSTLIIRNLDIDAKIPLEKGMKDIHDQIRTALAAGHDTTAFFGCYMAYLLSKNSEIQNKVRKEIHDNLLSTTYITAEDIEKLPYCRCVLQEVLRLYTVIPFINRTSTKEYKIETTNQIIPKNSTILIPLSIMNRSDKIWENPSQFNPDRFIDITGHNNAKKGYLPFGYGTRSCIGANLAMSEGIIMMIKLVSQFNILPDQSFKPKIIAGISLISKNGINVKLEKIL